MQRVGLIVLHGFQLLSLAPLTAAARTIWAASNGILTLFVQGTPIAEIKPSSELLFGALITKLVRPK